MSVKSRFESFLDHRVRVTIHDNREMVGTLLAFDQHLNLVLNDTQEIRKVGKNTDEQRTETRSLGIIVLRGEEVIHFHTEGSPASTGARSAMQPGAGIAVPAAPVSGPGLAAPSAALSASVLLAPSNTTTAGPGFAPK